MTDNGILARQQRLCSYIERGALGPEVVDDLLADGEPLEFETALWDYKIDLPDFTADLKGDPGLGRLIKTAASFYNSFGGYILAGVRNAPRLVVGYRGSFNCDLFSDIIFKYLKLRLSCAFRTHSYHTPGGAVPLGLLYIPVRPADVLPTEFRKTYISSTGQDIFKAGQIYLRRSHASVPATNSDDYKFFNGPSTALAIADAGRPKGLCSGSQSTTWGR